MARKKTTSDLEPNNAQLGDEMITTASENDENTAQSVGDANILDEEKAKLEAESDTASPSESKPKKTRVTVPKREITVILDGGRSRIKVLLIVDGQVTSNLVIDSVVCQTDAPPFGELGAFSMSRGKGEDKKDIVEHWVVGFSAKLQGKPFVAMSDGENHKVDYFPILALGAIASLPNLYDLSTGANEKSRSLTIKLITLSLANPLDLKAGLGACKWMKVDGVKYSLSFAKTALNYPEGYGAALFGQDKGSTVYTLDVGFGTAVRFVG